METEFEATLGYEKNQKADFLTDKKNGHSPKIFKSHYGKSKLVFHGIGMGNRIIILTPSAIPFSLVLYLSEQKNNCHFICYGSLLSPVFYTTFNNTSGTAFFFKTKYFVFSSILPPVCLPTKNKCALWKDISTFVFLMQALFHLKSHTQLLFLRP